MTKKLIFFGSLDFLLYLRGVVGSRGLGNPTDNLESGANPEQYLLL